MNKKTSVLFLLLVNKVSCIAAIDFFELVKNSENFNRNICEFPTKHNRIYQIAKKAEDQKKVSEQANSVRVIADKKIKQLIQNFLDHKRKFGSEIEKKFYQKMKSLEFLQRLIKNRPLVFYTERDVYKLQQKNIQGSISFEAIGTDDERWPLVLENYISYDEMEIAALLGVAVPTFFINSGSRFNKAIPDLSNNFEREGIYVGLVGARFEKPNLMEWKSIIITPEQNTKNNGYGLSRSSMNYMETFYEERFPTFQEAQLDTSGKYFKMSTNRYFNISIYKKRMKSVIKPFLEEADTYAQKVNKKVYCRVVGLGLGVWKITDMQEALMLDVYKEILTEEKFKNISDIEFLYFTKASLKNSKDYSITISFSEANPADKLVAENKDKLLVAMYAWDGNAYPGNEYWQGNLTGSGDPAAACCSTIAELQNPLVNTKVLDSCRFLLDDFSWEKEIEIEIEKIIS